MTARDASQERRSSERAKRRAAKSAPQVEQTGDGLHSQTTDAIWEAASAAIVGAAVGAAQALARKRDAERGEATEADRIDQQEEPEDTEEEPEADEPEEEPQEQVEELASQLDAAPQPQEPGRPGDAPKMVQRARQQLIDLRGVEPESVSGVARTGSGWRIGLEVVEVHRIPESTDVLATYEMELDADGELLTFERTHRYYRSEADRR